MKQTPTPAQENSLRAIFHGNHFERERAIAMQPPDLQPVLREMVKVKSNTEKLYQIMFADLLRANDEMLKNPEDQFWRRMTIRAFSATVDGIIFCLKQNILVNGTLAKYQFSENEKLFLTETAKLKDGKKFKLPPFRENVKETFKLFARIFNVACPVDFSQPGFDAFCDTYELRHRLIHPKHYMTFWVSDNERDRCKEAGAWLDTEIKRVITASKLA